VKILLRSAQLRLCLLCLVLGPATACVGGGTLVRRDTAELGPAALNARPTEAAPVWFGPGTAADEARISRWRRSVGPAVVRLEAPTVTAPLDEITLVSWNTAVGEGDVVRFVQTLPRGPLVLLLQEVYRAGPDVPPRMKEAFSFAGHLGGASAGPNCREIEDVAQRLGLDVYYVPSMRNGDLTSDEDRGNAILSSLPLTDLRAIELPFERQRRVAVSATIAGRTTSGMPWRVRLVSAHLDNMSTVRRAWIGAEYGRARQARELAAVFHDSEPTILAGDFNTWFGFADQAYLEAARAFPQTTVLDRRATFRGLLRLDHVFFRLQPGWRAEFRRADSRFGSDHYPLVGSVHFN
jgi:endonuclease/exonuclease/phosphatase family metal-dependent hydrolase